MALKPCSELAISTESPKIPKKRQKNAQKSLLGAKCVMSRNIQT